MGLCSAVAEGFTSQDQSGMSLIGAGLAVLLVIVLELFVVQWLWNNVLTRVLTVVKPLPSLLYTLGLIILVQLLHSA